MWANELRRRIRHGNLHYTVELPRTYRRAIMDLSAQHKYDVITVNLGSSYLAARTLKRQRFPGVFVVRTHGLEDRGEEAQAPWKAQLATSPGPLWKRVPRRLFRRINDSHLKKAAQLCDGYIVSSSLDAQHLTSRHGLSADRIACIPQAVSGMFRGQPVLPMDSIRVKRLLHVAGFHFCKSPHTVAQVANQVLADDAPFGMTWLCHQKDHPKVRELLHPQAASRLRLHGWVNQEELIRVYDSHGVFIFPSLFEGFGKVFLEAMSRGLCVIGTKTGGMADLIRPGENGFICDFASPGQILDCIARLASDPEKAKRVSLAAVESARQYTWKRVATEMIGFFQRLLVLRSPNATAQCRSESRRPVPFH